jgi:hypothetical protein
MTERVARKPAPRAAAIHGSDLAGIVESAVRRASQAEPVPLVTGEVQSIAPAIF